MERPPLSCHDCLRGLCGVYGTTLKTSPDLVYGHRHEVQYVGPRRTLLKEGEGFSTISMLYSGWAFTYKQLPDGRRQIFSFLLPSDVMVLDALCTPQLSLPYSVKSLTPISMCRFTIEGMNEILRVSPQQRLALEEEHHRNVAALKGRLFDLGRRSARGRLARLLIELKDRLERSRLVQEGRFHFPPRQEDLADALGLTTVYVNRTLVQLRNEGLIELQRQQLAILAEDKLRRIAEEE